jgi:DNA-binding CsgD family transcriptional regulator
LSEHNEKNGTGQLLPPKRSYSPLRLGEARELTPAPTGVGTWAEKLRDAAYDAIREDDVKAIIQKQVEKAKEGDAKATSFLLNFLTKPAPSIRVEQVVVKEPAKARKVKPAKIEAIARRRRAVAKLLAQGPRSLTDIAEALGLTEKTAEHLLEHEWFCRHANSRDWQITSLGRKEAA